MAQLVEQLIRNQQVAGSNPAISSKKRKDEFFRSFFFSDMTDLNRSSREGVSPTLCRGLPLAGNGNTRLSVKKKEKNMASKLVIREGVTEITEGQFKYSKIEELVLPSTLKKIGKEAFALCYNLKKVVMNSAPWKISTKCWRPPMKEASASSWIWW